MTPESQSPRVYDAIPEKLSAFITAQKIFFVGTAGKKGRGNISPKGMESFRIIDEHTVRWPNVTGSGNETTAHKPGNQRMTIMFCTFEGKPMILRLYGMAAMIQLRDNEWKQHSRHLPDYRATDRFLHLTLTWYTALVACLYLFTTTRMNVINLTTGPR